MAFQPDIRLHRQARYRARAQRAGRLARLMLPGLFLAVSAALMSDPALAPQLAEGLSVTTAALNTTPLPWGSPAAPDMAPQATAEVLVTNLPQAVTPILRETTVFHPFQ